MPFYPNLKFKEDDTEKVKKKKKRVISNIKVLRKNLSTHIENSRSTPIKGSSVKIATWNIREFGGNSYGGRSFEEIYYMAEIISHFDLIALQEVRSNLKELKELLRYLGPNWDFIATDVTDGSAGNKERMVFVFNNDEVYFKNIAGELTLKENSKVRAAFGERIKLQNGIGLNIGANNLSGTYDAKIKKSKTGFKLSEDLEIPVPSNCSLTIPNNSFISVRKGTVVDKISKGKAKVKIPKSIVSGKDFGLRFPENTFDDSLRQFARTPFLISFQAGWLKLNLCTVHIYYGSDSGNKLNQRKREIELLTEALAAKAAKEFKSDKESFLCVLGDFNIIGKNHPTMAALESNNFEVPKALKTIPGSNVKRDKTYDQIAFWNPNRRSSYSKLEILGANIFDFFNYIFTDKDEKTYRREGVRFNGLKKTSSYKTWRTYKMSDHLPMWIELRTDFNTAYLEYLESTNV